MTLSVRHLYSIDGRDASDFSTDPNPNRNGSTVLDPNSVYALDSLGTPPICQNHSSCNEDDYDSTRNPPSIHSCALEFGVPDPTRIAVALLSILSVSADSTRGPSEREIVRVAMNWPALPLLIHPERIGADGWWTRRLWNSNR